MSFTPADPQSALSVIPEATEENRLSTFIVTRPVPRKEEDKGALAESSTVFHTQRQSQGHSTADYEMNEFRSVALVGKQPYASCCCSIY